MSVCLLHWVEIAGWFLNSIYSVLRFNCKVAHDWDDTRSRKTRLQHILSSSSQTMSDLFNVILLAVDEPFQNSVQWAFLPILEV